MKNIAYIIYCLLGIHIYISCSTITFINNSHWAPLKLQISIDTDPNLAQVPGNVKDTPLAQHAAIEIPDITILSEHKLKITVPDNQLLHVRIATHGNARNSQIMLTVIGDTEIPLNDLGKGDIVVERDIEIVNATDKTVSVAMSYNALNPDYANRRCSWENHPHYFSGIPWSRDQITKIFGIFPAGSESTEKKLGMMDMFKRYQGILRLMSFTETRGALTLSCPNEWPNTTPWLFDSLLPFSGSRNTLTIHERHAREIFCLTNALHQRLGANSPACILPQFLLKEIGAYMPREPYIVSTYQ